jgi:tetratricopeptide (TPR) repeat protein
VGQVAALGNRYRLLGRIGTGGMAEVYRALSLGAHGFEKLVAVKRVLPAYAADPEFVERFIDEAKLAVHLTHANVVQIFDFGYMDESLYLAMELVEGLDLREVAYRIGRSSALLEPALAVAVGIEVLRGLQFAHERTDADGRPLGIVHCDVSPSNVLVSWAGEVKLTDFGIARANAPRRRSLEGLVAGKAPYMAPEQFEGAGIDSRADLFGVGVVLYELFVGRRPYAGDKDALLEAARGHDFVPPSVARPGVPSSLDLPIRAALAPNPADRPESAGALLRMLVDARRAAGLADDPLLVRERMRRLGPDAPQTHDEALDDALRETAVRSLLQTAKEAPRAVAGAEEAALPTRATRAVAVPVGRGRRRAAALLFSSILAIAAAAFALTRLGDRAPDEPALPHGHFAAGPALARTAKRAESALVRALEALPPADAGTPAPRVTGRLRPAPGGVSIDIDASVGARAGHASARAAEEDVPDRVPAIATEALAQALGHPLLLPGPGDPPVASALSYNLAVVSLARGQIVRTVGRLDDLLALEPDFDEALYLRVLAAWGYMPTNAAAIARARERFASDPRRSAVVEVVDHLASKRYREAVGAAERSRRTIGDDPDLDLFYAEALVRSGEFDAGLARLRSLRTKSPFIGLLAYRGAQHALAMDDGPEVRMWLESMRTTDPQNPVAAGLEAEWTLRHGTRAEIARLADDPDLSDFDAAGDVRLVLSLAAGDTRAIRETYSRLALDGSSSEERARAARNLARLGLADGKLRDRARWIELAKRNDPSVPGPPVAAQAALAGVLDPAGALDAIAHAAGAAREIDAAVLAAAAGRAPEGVDTNDREVSATIEGLARARAGDVEGAVAALRRAARAPTDGSALPLAGFLRAWLTRETRPAEVVEACDFVLRPRAAPIYVAPLHPRCLRWTATALRALGRTREAQDAEHTLARLWRGADRPITWLDEPPFRLVP